jgi:hypothetical protein
MSLGKFGNGSTFRLGTNSTVSELISIGLPEMSGDDIDITTHNDSDKIREFIKGLIDSGEIAIEGNMSFDEYAILYNAMATTSLYSLTITLPTLPEITTFEANCYVKSVGGATPHDEKIDMSASLKITGNTSLDGSFAGILDELGNADNAKLIFSPYKRLTSNFEGDLVKVQRTSDNTSQWFGYDDNGDLDTASLLSFVGASDGLVEEIANQNSSGNNATQTDNTKMPKIVSSGVLETNGLLFDGLNDYMEISNYSDININTAPLSLYVNYYPLVSSTSYILSKNGASNERALSLLNTATIRPYLNETEIFSQTQNISAKNTLMFMWETGTNNTLLNLNGSESQATYNTEGFTNNYNVCIGARFDTYPATTVYHNGHVKSFIIFNTDEYSKYDDLKDNV